MLITSVRSIPVAPELSKNAFSIHTIIGDFRIGALEKSWRIHPCAAGPQPNDVTTKSRRDEGPRR